MANRYRIEHRLGIGGMGEVVAATDLQTGTRVALKVPRREIRDRRDGARFLREARLLERLQTPHVPRVLDAGIWRASDGELPFLAFELLDGVDLATWLLRRGPLDAATAAEVVRQAASGIEAAHGSGLVHRDLKPSNLFLSLGADGAVSIKVLDFGIARSVGVIDERITGTDEVIGSPGYMAPEQMRPGTAVDHRSDIWALGVVLYEAATRRLPFPSKVFPELCLQILLDPPVAPPAEQALPAPLWDVISRCLEKEPARRYASATALRAALAPHATPLRLSATDLELVSLDADLDTRARSWATHRPRARPRRRIEWLVALSVTMAHDVRPDPEPVEVPRLDIASAIEPAQPRVVSSARLAVPPPAASVARRPATTRSAPPLVEPAPVSAREDSAPEDPLASPF